jgi:eukaryotic-like serine/threonine-protein kinase
MSADKPTSLEELFPLLLAAYDDSQAADAPSWLAQASGIPPDFRQRVEKEASWCRTVRRLLRAPGTTPTHSTDPDTTASSVSPTVKPGASFGRFQISRELGRGSYGVVFLAYDPILGREVALKVPRPEALVSPVLRARFRQEARAAAGLDHPNLVPVYEVGEEGPVCYIASGYCPGITLAAWLKQRTEPVPYQQAAQLLATLAGAVAHAHERGVVHRDLKPGNILLQKVGEASTWDEANRTPIAALYPTPGFAHPVSSFGFEPKITDFGLAKLVEGDGSAEVGQTQTGAILGTPSYMAPEQAEAKKAIGPTADIYALGATLYELLTGRPPFVADSSLEMLLLVRNQEPLAPSRLRPQLPRDLETICLKCLQKEPARRYESAAALAADLNHFRNGEPIVARPVGSVERLTKWARRRPAVATLLAGLVVAVTGGSLATSILWLRAEHQSGLADRARAEAEAQNLRAQERLVSMHVATGIRLMDEGNLFGSLPWFVKALEEEKGGPEQEALHRIRIACILRQCPRLNQLWIHDSRVRRAQVSPDGRWVVSACDDGAARVWEVDGGQLVSTTLKHRDILYQAAFSPDGQRVVTASKDGTARVWDARTGQPVSPPLQHRDLVVSAGFSPDGRRVATASFDFTAQVWDSATGQRLAPPLKHTGPVTEAAFSPDGKWVVTASSDTTAQVWDAASGKPWGAPLRHGRSVSGAAFSPDGRWIVTSSADDTARVWDAATSQPVSPTLPHTTPFLRYSNVRACFSPDGRRVATAGLDHAARVWDPASGRPLSPILKHVGAVLDVAFSADGQRLVTASEDDATRLWESVSGRLLSTPLEHGGQVWQATFFPDGRRVATASSDQTARVWDAATGQPLLLKHSRNVTHATFSPDGRWVLTASDDSTARVWDADNGRPVSPPLRHARFVKYAAFSPDGRLVVTASDDRTARVWDAATGEALSPPLRHTAIVRYAEFSPDGGRVVTASEDFTARIWDATSGQPLSPPLRHAGLVKQASFSPDGERLVTVSDDGTAQVRDAASGRPVSPPFKHESAVFSAAFSPDDRLLLTGGWSETAALWDVATGARLPQSFRHTHEVTRAVFSPDGRRIVTASNDHTARVWDVASGQPVSPPLKHNGRVGYAGFSPDGRLVVTASEDGSARVWDAVSGQPLCPPLSQPRLGNPSAVTSAAFSPDSRRVVTGCEDGGARVWDLSPDDRPLADLAALASLLSGRTVDEHGAERAADAQTLGRAWATFRSRYPDSFCPSADEILAWHSQEAQAAEGALNWEAALFHLNRLVLMTPENAAFRCRRGRAYAALGQWQNACRDFQADYGDLPGVSEMQIGWHALACAMLGNVDGERQVCAAMLRRPGLSVLAGNNIAWFCSRFPNSVADRRPVLALAEKAAEEYSRDCTCLNTLGVALYRAGQFPESIQALEKAIRLNLDQEGTALDWLFLAMAHERLGHKEEARKWLAKAIAWRERSSQIPEEAAYGKSSLRWDERAEVQLICKEANDLIRPMDKAPK